MLENLRIQTQRETQLIEITSDIENIIQRSGVRNGICTIFVPHTTAGITINENADPTVVRDMLKVLNKVIPFDDQYEHSEGNSAAHIKMSLMGSSEQIIIHEGRLLLGRWQGIYFTEFDGPRNREIYIKIIEG